MCHVTFTEEISRIRCELAFATSGLTYTNNQCQQYTQHHALSHQSWSCSRCFGCTDCAQ
eukprot:m.173788 g.173788  ORF g.173788 m.173788 type:complete len:59 (+) comp31742_c3_seq8:404-580(+)